MSKGELAFVDWLASTCRVDPNRVPIGIGDDMAAVLLDGRLVLVTADMLLDGVHFESARQPLRRIGAKAIACSLSDCAAMACRPRGAVVSVALPDTMSMEFAQELYAGMIEAGEAFRCPIIGGDTTSWRHPLAIDVSMIAEPMTARGPVLRNGAAPGDRLLITGPLGGSLRGRHLTFTPRLAEAEHLATVLGQSLHAMIDVTDGLALDAWRMCRASRCGAEFDERLLEAAISDAARQAADADNRSPLEHALSDGEDFELLLCVHPDAESGALAALPTLRPLGRIVPAPAGEPILTMRTAAGAREVIEPRGYEHFR